MSFYLIISTFTANVCCCIALPPVGWCACTVLLLVTVSAVRKSLSDCEGAELVGREAEVTEVRDFLHQQQPAAMYISGAPGTGKTAALQHVLATAPVCHQRARGLLYELFKLQ